MAKVKKAYFCKECGYEAPKWMGRCPACGEWNTFTEEIVARESGSVPAAMTSALPRSTPQRVGEIRSNDRPRLDLGNAEVNRVLGGGLVPGSLVLLGGEPGIGKSTLSLQIALADNGLKTLYVSGEESAEQIKMRADRIGIGNDACMVYSETLLENIMAQLEEQRPDLVIIDSIQTIYTDLIESLAGSVSQIRECAATLLKYAKGSGTSIFIIGHITKEGAIAGPKILEHIVDVVLQFEGDNNQVYRILRGIKNRFGATFEIGVFEMLDAGLRPVGNPSEILLTHYDAPLSGIAVGASVDGIRPYLIEVQALVSNAAYGTPQRTATGFDYKRMSMLLAVLEKRVGMKMYTKDVFLNFAGGFKVADPGLDLAIIAAVISSYYDRPIGEGICCAGEVGLSGEVRPAPRTEQRISEAARLGFRRIVVSGYLPKGAKRPKGIEVVAINSIDQLPRALFLNEEYQKRTQRPDLPTAAFFVKDTSLNRATPPPCGIPTNADNRRYAPRPPSGAPAATWPALRDDPTASPRRPRTGGGSAAGSRRPRRATTRPAGFRAALRRGCSPPASLRVAAARRRRDAPPAPARTAPVPTVLCSSGRRSGRSAPTPARRP